MKSVMLSVGIQPKEWIEKTGGTGEILEKPIGTGPFKVEVDLMQPLDPEKKPAVHTTPLNHIGLWIDDLPVAVEWLTAQGVRFAPGGIRKGAAGFDITFLHPKANEEFPIGGEGVLIEISRITTEMDVAMDSFYVYGRDGGKITSRTAIRNLQKVLHNAAVKTSE